MALFCPICRVEAARRRSMIVNPRNVAILVFAERLSVTPARATVEEGMEYGPWRKA
jgi:hypothetical protein